MDEQNPFIRYGKTTSQPRKKWSSADEARFEKLAEQNTPTRVIGIKLGRTEDSVRSKAQDLDVSLKPTNQKPYNRRK